MNVFDEAKKWFDKAKEDLRVASLLLNEIDNISIDISCYLSQQATEKALKGYLISQGVNPPKIHNLGML
ncbi:MAG: HEPN domain-containing protein [Deltaproteobacteria bacterium]|jgi:HEPN domain-containing protein|nr:HEPN domain-containing protein [Deltaproteobacteria bacterium]